MNDSTADKDNESVASQNKTEAAESPSTQDPERSDLPGRHSADAGPDAAGGSPEGGSAAPAADNAAAAAPGADDAETSDATANHDTSAGPDQASSAAAADTTDTERNDSPVAAGSSDVSLSTAELPQQHRDEESERRAAERDKAVRAKPVLARVVQLVAAVFFPVIVLAGAVRLITTPAFLWLEYHRPGFPDDRFGFGLEERMTYGSYAMDYLLNFAPAQYLGGLVNAAGDPLFASDEVAHMTDVKMVMQLTLLAAVALVLLETAALIYLARRYPGGVRRSLFAGAVITLLLIIAIAVLAILGWQQFFAAFHSIFFADGTWTFAASDTLIRLFPGQFWIDSGIAVAAVVLVVSTLTLAFTWPTKPRRDRTRYRY
ncbi:DUF1461 domain-containing protein [Arthrobacter pigmenti]